MWQGGAVEGGRPSASAQHVALARAHFHRIGAVDDPHAAAMLRTSWSLAARALRLAPRRRIQGSTALAFLAARTLAVDAAVTAALDDGVAQVVTVGAGYDSRPWRLARPGVRFVELDHPATQADKRRRAPDGAGPTYVPLAVGDDPLAPALERAGWDPTAPGVAVVEGLTMYLDQPVVADLLSGLADAGAPTSRLVVNFGIGFASDDGPRHEIWARRVLAFGREPFRCELPAAEVPGFLAAAGWEPDEVLSGPEAAARHLPGTGLPVDRVGVRSVIATAHRP